MVSFNTTDEVRRHLGLDSGNNYLTDAEIQDYLDEANDDLYVKIKKKYERQRYRAILDEAGAVITEYEFSLAPVVSVYQVYVNGTLKTVTTHYTIDTEKDTLTFTASTLASGDVIEILYIPKIYHLAELFLALYNITLRTSVISEADTNPLQDAFEAKKDIYFRTIKQKTVVSSWH